MTPAIGGCNPARCTGVGQALLAYALPDREESGLGINCVAFATFLGSPHVPSGAVSVSAVANRTPLSVLLDGLDDIRALLADRLVQARRAPALVD